LNCDVGISWFTCLIPVTIDEEANQSTESSISIKELLSIIQTLLGSLNETNRPRFEWIKSKNKDDLLLILQQVKERSSQWKW